MEIEQKLFDQLNQITAEGPIQGPELDRRVNVVLTNVYGDEFMRCVESAGTPALHPETRQVYAAVALRVFRLAEDVMPQTSYGERHD